MTINRVQSWIHLTSAANAQSLNVTLSPTPAVGHVLVAAISSFNGYGNIDSSVSTMEQQGVNWTKQVKNQQYNIIFDIEIWTGVVSAGVQPNLTITLFNAPSQGIIADICEYQGISATYDRWAPSIMGNGGDFSDTGTTPTTTTNNQLWVGAVYTYYDTQSIATNGFTRLDGTFNGSLNSMTYLEKIVSSTGPANSGTDLPNSWWIGCIATFPESVGLPIIVPFDGKYSGNGSKQLPAISYTDSITIMQVESNLVSPHYLQYGSSAVIENLVIDGLSLSNQATGILLRNVYNCCIRNVTIKNCEVGIKVELTDGYWSHANRFEHIRMENVKTGIMFVGTNSSRDFKFTTIDDVGISVADNDSVGIELGDTDTNAPYAQLNNAFIKATVWLNGTTGTGMKLASSAEIKYSLVNLEVEGPSGGKGMDIDTNSLIANNQSFFLATGTCQEIIGPVPTDPAFKKVHWS